MECLLRNRFINFEEGLPLDVLKLQVLNNQALKGDANTSEPGRLNPTIHPYQKLNQSIFHNSLINNSTNTN